MKLTNEQVIGLAARLAVCRAAKDSALSTVRQAQANADKLVGQFNAELDVLKYAVALWATDAELSEEDCQRIGIQPPVAPTEAFPPAEAKVAG